MEESVKKTPLNAISRLKEAYRLWIKTAESYEDPEEFRIYLNACIQALRNVTFVLQKQKKEINNFDEWYKSWQDVLRGDPIMIWCVSARNKIVKEGDLKKDSVARASYVASYNDVPNNDFVVDPILATDKIAINIANTKLPDDLKQEGYLRVERRWVAADLQDYELLDALGYAFSVLARLVMDSDAQRGPSLGNKNETGENHIKRGIDNLSIDNDSLPVCMTSFADYRTVWVKLSTMETYRYVSRTEKHELMSKEKIID